MKRMADAHERVFIHSLIRAWWGLLEVETMLVEFKLICMSRISLVKPHLPTQLLVSLRKSIIKLLKEVKICPMTEKTCKMM